MIEAYVTLMFARDRHRS